MSYVRSRADIAGTRARLLPPSYIHIHIPEGEFPKMDLRRELTLATALISDLTKDCRAPRCGHDR